MSKLDSSKEFEQAIHPLIGFSDYCWYWLGYINPKGYGRVRFDGATRQAHRVVYAAMKAIIPVGAVLDHLCRNTVCVNPDHLEPVSDYENKITRGYNNPAALNARKTHCKRGHKFEEGSYYINSFDGGKLCKLCVYLRQKSYRAKAKEVKSEI